MVYIVTTLQYSYTDFFLLIWLGKAASEREDRNRRKQKRWQDNMSQWMWFHVQLAWH